MRASTRDQEFTDFVSRSRPALLRTATLLAAGDGHLAEDLVQTCLTRMYLAWPRLRTPEARPAYARRTLANALVDEVRRPWRRREQSHADLPDEPVSEGTGEHASDLLSPALAALPPRMRAAVVFRYLHDMSVEQAADALNCSQGTVKSQTARGLDHLRASFGVDLDPASARPPRPLLETWSSA